MNLNLEGRRALVCGGSRGIGKAIGEELASLGAEVVLLSRNEDSLRGAVKDLPTTSGQKHSYAVIDLADHANLSKAVSKILSYGPIHILVNNAGGPTPGTILEAETEAFTDAINQHLLANHLLMKLLIPVMKAQNFGRIINVISTSVREPIPGLGVSNATRAAVASWAKTLSVEVAPFGITVNNILPGFTDTERLNQIFQARAEKTGTRLENVKREMLSHVPMGRMARPEEIAAVAGFFASPAASYITGTSLCVDGGRTRALA